MGRWEDAIEVLSDMTGIHKEAALLKLRADALAESGRWNDALNDLQQVNKSGNDSVRLLSRMALTRIAAENIEGYQDVCDELLNEHGKTTDPTDGRLVAYTCALRPQESLDYGRLLALAALAFYEGDAENLSRATLGAILYRAGLYEDATQQLAAVASPNYQDFDYTPTVLAAYFLALTQRHWDNWKGLKKPSIAPITCLKIYLSCVIQPYCPGSTVLRCNVSNKKRWISYKNHPQTIRTLQKSRNHLPTSLL